MQRIAWLGYYIYYEMTADGISPFVPGIPNQSKFNEFLKHCQFKVSKETETHICISGKPINRMESNLYNEFKLRLGKEALAVEGRSIYSSWTKFSDRLHILQYRNEPPGMG